MSRWYEGEEAQGRGAAAAGGGADQDTRGFGAQVNGDGPAGGADADQRGPFGHHLDPLARSPGRGRLCRPDRARSGPVDTAESASVFFGLVGSAPRGGFGLAQRWIVASLVFVAAFSVFCGVASVDDRPSRWAR
ncbi:hypothetical protein [Streptomyces sp. NPDC026589]|uniref:hypothetical protein n=1 Tax=Streptomyces sp. NPDC026589 TaxID=3155609 RepID=UPI0033C48651